MKIPFKIDENIPLPPRGHASKYKFADMIDRAATAQEIADAKEYCLTHGWENGFTMALIRVIEERDRALAAVPPAPTAANRTPVERLRAVLEMQASPTTDRGDSHGARGQKGWIVYESSLPFIAADLKR